MTPSLPAGADRAAALNSSSVRPSMLAVATRFRAPFNVQTSGRKPPVASANPATTPEPSWVWSSLGVKTVPLVPSDTPAVPGRSPSPRPAAMLSPVPGASAMPPGVAPTTSWGAATLGTVRSWPMPSSIRSRR